MNSQRRSLRDFPRAQAIFPSIYRLESRYRHSHLPNNGSTAAVAFAAVTTVTVSIDAAVLFELIASLEEIIAAMMTHSHCNCQSHNH